MLKALVPVKSISKRVPNKNFRSFYGSLTLTDITVRKLLENLPPEDIYLSTDSDFQGQGYAEQYGINFLPRQLYLTSNGTPITEVIRSLAGQVPGDDDIALCMVCDPLFDRHEDVFRTWNQARQDGFDSLSVLQEKKEYLLDSDFNPIGFGFGEDHVPSQRLPSLYRLNFALSILTRDSIDRTGYHVGNNPYWYTDKGPSLDIDTPWDFEAARAVFARHGRSTWKRSES